MNCPYCEKEMFRGFVYEEYIGEYKQMYKPTIKWRPEGKTARRYEVKLSVKNDLFFSDKVETFYCYDCKKMIIDIDTIDALKQEQEEKEAKSDELRRNGVIFGI